MRSVPSAAQFPTASTAPAGSLQPASRSTSHKQSASREAAATTRAPTASSATTRPRASPSFAAEHVEIICILTATHASTGNTFESRASYTAHNTHFGHRFCDALVHNTTGDGDSLKVDLKMFHQTEKEDPKKLLKPQCY